VSVKTSWAVTVVISIAILGSTVLERAVSAPQLNEETYKTLFYLQYPGFAVALNRFGVHSGPG